MKRKLALVSLLTMPFLTWAQSNSSSLDEKINQIFADATGWFPAAMFAKIPITESVGIPWVLIVLIVGAGYFTFYFKFINFSGFFTAINVVRGKYDSVDVHEPQEDILKTIKIEGVGEVSHFQALTAALSATVGLGI